MLDSVRRVLGARFLFSLVLGELSPLREHKLYRRPKIRTHLSHWRFRRTCKRSFLLHRFDGGSDAWRFRSGATVPAVVRKPACTNYDTPK